MFTSRVKSLCVATMAIAFLAGCSTEKAHVSVTYTLEPSKGLPAGMTSISIMDSKVNEVTDTKWSELAANQIQDLLQRAVDQYHVDLKIADRKHLSEGLAEQDLAAAGITQGRGGNVGMGGQVMDVQGIIESEINVKVDAQRGRQSTISGLSGFGGRHWGGGSVQTREVETVTRNITVQTTFKLVDTVNNRNWVTYAPPPVSNTDRTNASFLFGSSQTEAELMPRDEVIGLAVQRGIIDFVSQIVPCAVTFDMTIVASGNKACVRGVKMLRAGLYSEALSNFKIAMAEGSDHQAAFGAGIASESLKKYDQALSYYRRAYGMKDMESYAAAVKRLSKHMPYIRR